MNVETEQEREDLLSCWSISRGALCLRENYCKGCAYCVEACPNDVLSVSEKFNEKGYHPPEATDPERCTGCGLCGLICPDFAIWVEEEERDES
jgi:2-oxoglutarate ferredoxin oxidoreductase subunit delta